MEHYHSIAQAKKNRSLTHDSFDLSLCNTSTAHELLKNNLAKLKKGEGKLTKGVKEIKSLKHNVLVFEEENQGHFRKGTHHLLTHDLAE